MALIAMACYDTEENNRSDYTQQTIDSLINTVDLTKHTLIVVDNGSCQKTKDIWEWVKGYREATIAAIGSCNIRILINDTNEGTAMAINKALCYRQPGDHFIKIDNDVVIHKSGWVEEMQECIERMPKIGVLGLKRRDVCESVYSINTDQRSRLLEVPHEAGQKWYVVEECKHVMGTCTMLNPALLDKVGFFYQMDGLYGFDDSLMCVRSEIAGFINCFLHGIDIDHIDPGGDAYTEWKAKYAGEMIGKYAEAERAYKSGMMNVYYNPFQ